MCNAFFYVDGFNLYLSRLRRLRRYRWLDLGKLADRLVPKSTSVDQINFYTAYVSGKIDPDAVGKQQAYLRALKSIDRVSIHAGNFQISEKWVKLIHPPDSRPIGYAWTVPFPEMVRVSTAQEKGSDVKLASHLLRDAFHDKFDIAYVITNDTDLVEPIRIVTTDFKKQVNVVAPIRQANGRPVPAKPLKEVASSISYIDDSDLAHSQFPPTVSLAKGKTVTRPSGWC